MSESGKGVVNPGKAVLKVSRIILGIAGLVFVYTFLAISLEGEELIKLRDGESGTFEMKRPGRLILIDTNVGLGSSPGIILAEGARLFDPDGELCELDEKKYEGKSRWLGEYRLSKTGFYRLEFDELEGGAESHAILRKPHVLPGSRIAGWVVAGLIILAIPIAIIGGVMLPFSPKKSRQA